MKYNLNPNLLRFSDSNIFAMKLTAEDIKQFLEENYLFTNVISVEIITNPLKTAITFKVSGRYLHAGVNNVCFEGVFYAYDSIYFFETITEQYRTSHLDLWRKFLFKKFGNEYVENTK